MALSKHDKVHHVFQNISEQYDFMNDVISFNQHKRWRRKAMAIMDVKEGADALDVCCGTGDWTLSLSEACGSRGHVTGLDFSDKMLEVADKKVKAEQIGNISLVHGDAMQLPFPDNRFDFVTIGFGLRNTPDYQTVLGEMNRVLKPGGMLMCLETSQPETAVYKQLYFFYFSKIMPLFGKIFANRYKEYTWLQESTRSFPDKKTLAGMFSKAGFSGVSYQSLSGGAAAIHWGRK